MDSWALVLGCILILALLVLLGLVIIALILWRRRIANRAARSMETEMKAMTKVKESLVEAAIGMHAASIIHACHAIQAKIPTGTDTESGFKDTRV